jgi:hypothetical protein
MKDKHCSALALPIITAFYFQTGGGRHMRHYGFHLKIAPARAVSMGPKTI